MKVNEKLFGNSFNTVVNTFESSFKIAKTIAFIGKVIVLIQYCQIRSHLIST